MRPVVRRRTAQRGRLGDRRRRELGRSGGGDRVARRGLARRPGQLCPRGLERAVGGRVPGRPAHRLRAARSVRHRRGGVAFRAHQRGTRNRHRQAPSLLRGIDAQPHRLARHHDHRRPLQPIRVPRDRVALVLRLGRVLARSSRAPRRLSLPRNGHGGRHFHLDRNRPAVRNHRHPEYRRPRWPARGRRDRFHCKGGVRLLARGGGSQGRDLPAARVAAQRLRLRSLGSERLPGRHRDQGCGVCADALRIHLVRCRVRFRHNGAGSRRAAKLRWWR